MSPPVCPHCRKPFVPEAHNAWRQRYCLAEACQRARNRESCRWWRQANPGRFKDDVECVRDWRLGHPRYWRHEWRKAFTADILMPVHSEGREAQGVRIRDLGGFTLRHVVLRRGRGWLGYPAPPPSPAGHRTVRSGSPSARPR